MRDEKTVSVIVPIYNVENYLGGCIESLIVQTYKNIEIILVDDGSTDKSSYICDEYAIRDSRIKVVHKQNGGPSSSREAGIYIATGDFIMIVDGDDWIEPETVEECINVIRKREDVDCVFFSYTKEFPGKSIPMHIMDNDMEFTAKQAEDKVYRRLFGLADDELNHPERMDNIVSCCMKLYRQDVAKKGRYFDNRVVGSSEDTLFNMYALYDCKSIVYIDRCFYHYRKVETSLTNAYRAELDEKWNVLFNTMKRIIDEKNLSEKYQHALNNRIALSIIGIGMNELANEKASIFQKHRKIRRYLRDSLYHEKCKAISVNRMPIVWKIFFFCCKCRCSMVVFIMLMGMTQLRKR